MLSQQTVWLLFFLKLILCVQKIGLSFRTEKESFILMPPHTSIYRFCMQSFHNAGSTLSFCVLPVQNLLSAQWKLAKGSVFLQKAAFSSFVSLRLLLSRLMDWKSYLLELPIKKYGSHNLCRMFSAVCEKPYVRYFSIIQHHSHTMYRKRNDPCSGTLYCYNTSGSSYSSHLPTHSCNSCNTGCIEQGKDQNT